MSTIHDFPLADVSPYEEVLFKQLNSKSRERILRFGDATVELDNPHHNTHAKLALTQTVDQTEFTKVFRDKLKDIARLSRTAQNVLWYIMDNIPKDKGYVIIDNETVMDYCGFKTRKSVREAVIELLEKNIITRSTVHKKFWINPLIMFNGSRITYAKEYILDEADED